MVAETIRESIEKALIKLDIESVDFVVEHPTDLENGDYATNVALIAGKKLGKNSKELAENIVKVLRESQDDLNLDEVEIAGLGFINFYQSRDFFSNSLAKIGKEKDEFGKNENFKGQKTMMEFTDPNPFKELHIGHLMSNAIGESLSRLMEFSGAEVKRANYQGDVGVHVAKAIWGKMQKSDYSWGEAYAHGAQNYEENKEDIDKLNKTIYERSDDAVNKLYDEGKKESLAQFEDIYKQLGTKFDEYFFESEAGDPGTKVVRDNIGEVFEESDGAIVFPEEKSGLHTRVFLTSQGLPTYEAKELGLAHVKYGRYPYDFSMIVTANEIDDYFKVLLKAMEVIYPDLAKKTKHLSHGMLRLPSGKMSSRTGNVITASFLIDEAKKQALKKMEDKDEKIAELVAVGAVKYAILKQAIGKDIIFDMEKSLSLEGDSGPYLQYTYVRAMSVLAKAKKEGIKPSVEGESADVSEVERLLYRFPEVIDEATREYAPHKVLHFLTAVASSFNSFYAAEKIVDSGDKTSPYKLALTQAVAIVLKNGLYTLGIPVPDRM